ncbi:cytochrome b5-related protein-like [Pectinophora gossypiella]|uniref:cytochrome b5-related protein-like n=1 Tax=Pectinophora gossypiella TaxID=13191 RepID=UPI00214E3875|nr:cytochrome b5-related protein-like [Pectinophora gossypiella]
MAPNVEYLEVAHQRAVEKKTHVSFPQLKYPSLRDEGLRDPVQWLTGKAMDDGAEGLWRVHNGLYDLTDFIKRHPGGAEWLELSKGLDITEAFECHHLSPSVDKMLAKFYVREAKTPRNSPFTFKDDGFYRTLKREVVEELKKVPKSVPKYADMVIDGLFGTLLVTSALSCWAKNYWVVTASYLIASLCLAWVTVAAHNYIHRKSNWRMYLFNLSMWSYRDFRVSHVLSHHLYPNTLNDLEVSAFEPLVFWNPRRDVPLLSKFAFLIELVTFPLGFLKNFLVRFYLNFAREGFFTEHYRWHDGLGLLLPVWMWLVSGTTFSEAFVTWLWINCTGSFIFYMIGSNAAHHHPKIFKDGDQVKDPNPDWGMHELEAVMDRTDINGNLFKVMTFFGDHALHHLFPTLDHAVLPYLYPAFLKNVEKYRANFRMTSSFELFVGQIKQTLKTEPNVLEDN